jgi:O-antigen ligase/polysaccharide polymerase Wzy-like membrane protein
MDAVVLEKNADLQAVPAVEAGSAERVALRVMQAGAIAVVLAASTHKSFELDRFFVPKELALHISALAAGLLALRSIRRIMLSRLDLLLIGYLLLSAVSTVTATNQWLALRAVAISASGMALFWTARALRESGLSRSLIHGLAISVVVAAMTSLLQAYGVRIDLFSLNRAPGGTFGNRNFVAHVAAFGLPVCLLAALWARHFRGWLIASLGTAMVTASLVLTRSRAAWLAAAAVIIIFCGALILSGPLRSDGRTWRRFAGVVVLAAGAIAAALLIPNTLRWRSDNPYLESVTGVVNYEEGSGRGRLVQYQHSLGMAARHPVLGVGPANWSVVYPRYAARNDPSMDDSEPGATLNPWPSSDWIAFTAERGFAAALLMLFVFLGIAAIGFRRLISAHDREEGLNAAALLVTVIAAGIAGMFDAVLLLAAPALLVWMALGTLWPAPPAGGDLRARWVFIVVFVAVLACAALGATRSAAQLIAMEIYSSRSDHESLRRATRIDPGNYRIRLRLARSGSRKQRCEHARAARALFPNADAARDLARGCGQ